MRNLFRTLNDYYNRQDFRVFQNQLSEDVYENLGLSYTNGYNEVKMVTELCNTLNNRRYEQFQLYAKKIHGSKSYVLFKNKDKPVTTELADMVIITTAVKNYNVVFEKACFVQNKKESNDGKWKIDPNQLFLLKNFPSFTGTKGIFSQSFSKQSISYKNQTKTLGMYGLFSHPGEMTLVSADLINRYQDHDTIELSKIKTSSQKNCNNSLPFFDPMHFEDMYMFQMKRGYAFYPFSNLPFLQDIDISLDIYDFIRNWTMFNIGEPVVIAGNVVDEQMKAFNDLLLRQFEDVRSTSTNVANMEFENDMIVLILKLSLGE